MVATLEAEGIRAFIPGENTSATLPYLSFAINPNGVQVLVSSADVEAAREALDAARSARPDGTPEDEEAAEDESNAQYCADRAARSALFAWLLPPLVFYTLYWMVKALRAAAGDPPKDRAAFRQNLWVAACLGVGMGAVMGVFLIVAIRRWV